MSVNNKELTLKYDKTKPNISTVVMLNCDKAKEILNWEPKTEINEGIRKTSEWYKKEYLNK